MSTSQTPAVTSADSKLTPDQELARLARVDRGPSGPGRARKVATSWR